MAENKGWISLYRSLLDKPIWQCSTPEQKTIFITILLLANHKEREWEWQGKPYKCKPGQFITSIPSLVERCGKGITTQKVRTALNKFKKYGFLTDESTNNGRLITIVNWELYQGIKNETNIQVNRQATGNQQADNRQVTPNNNVNNDNNVNKNIFTFDSIEYKLSEHLFKHVKGNNPNAKEPNLQKWAKTFDYILRIDKRDLDEVKRLIEFCQKHHFWYKNILSANKFREKYDRLILEFNEKNKQCNNKQNKEDWRL
ncbi:hypothetical protein [Clostridium tetani]|uniref:hypothetical protein n=1 Tax=Clostridium tetani TaxID=1513 RepID=UPI00100A7B24|nr:hypothetical protein [Clostridium tetani]RXM57312.1 hypothetical protein DP133_09370 [Clostridium tetani]RXM77168.1 hypothetical protein DP154_06440 [Clostridium tetani]RYU99413.1 hypothetical protein DP144_06450 [Clostridium tetani]